MKSFSGMSSTRRAALTVTRRAMKTQSTKKNKESSAKTLKASSSGQRKKVPKLFWIVISNVHEKVAYEDIVRGIFQHCVKLNSSSDPSGHFKDNIEVAFEAKKDAEEAVNLFSNKIRFFQKIWRIHHYRPPSDVAPSSSLKNSDSEESSKDLLGLITRMVRDSGTYLKNGAIGVGASAKINITNMDERVPIGVVEPLFKTVGGVKSFEVFRNSNGIFQGTVELVYEQSEDAVAAVKLFDDNIKFFGRTWLITHEEPNLFWIMLSNVHEKVAYLDIVQAIFQRCVMVKSKFGISNSGEHSETSYEVGFETKKDAVGAVNQFRNKIRIFGKMWRIHHHRISDAAPSSSLRIYEYESSDAGSENLTCIRRAAAIGISDSPKVTISNIDARVPKEAVKSLFRIAGVVSSYKISNNLDDIFLATAEVVYERSDVAKAAVRLFFDNIIFFGKTWSVMRKDPDDDEEDDHDSGPLSSTGSAGIGPPSSTGSVGS